MPTHSGEPKANDVCTSCRAIVQDEMLPIIDELRKRLESTRIISVGERDRVNEFRTYIIALIEALESALAMNGMSVDASQKNVKTLERARDTIACCKAKIEAEKDATSEALKFRSDGE